MNFNMDFDKIINALFLKSVDDDARKIILLLNKYGIYGADAAKFMLELLEIAEQLKYKNKQDNN